MCCYYSNPFTFFRFLEVPVTVGLFLVPFRLIKLPCAMNQIHDWWATNSSSVYIKPMFVRGGCPATTETPVIRFFSSLNDAIRHHWFVRDKSLGLPRCSTTLSFYKNLGWVYRDKNQMEDSCVSDKTNEMRNLIVKTYLNGQHILKILDLFLLGFLLQNKLSTRKCFSMPNCQFIKVKLQQKQRIVLM